MVINFEIEILALIKSLASEFSVLKSYTLYQTGQLIFIWIECQVIVFEVVYLKWRSVLACYLFAANTAYLAYTPGIYLCKCIFFVMVMYAVFIGVHIDILLLTRQLQTAVTVIFRVDITAATDGKQTGVEFNIIGCILIKLCKPFAVGKGYLLAVFATAKV